MMRNRRQYVRSRSILSSRDIVTASARIENMYDVKTTLEFLMDALGSIQDQYWGIDETDPRYILTRYIYDIDRHIQAAYNKACDFIERDV